MKINYEKNRISIAPENVTEAVYLEHFFKPKRVESSVIEHISTATATPYVSEEGDKNVWMVVIHAAS